MRYITKLKIAAALQLCDVEKKSTEYALQYIQDICKVDMDAAIKIIQLPDNEKRTLYNEVNLFNETMERIYQSDLLNK